MSDTKKIPLICVVGPTASGKTSLGVELAKRYSGEVISADSMQIYRGIPIAAAVPSIDERGGVPHHLMEFVDNTESFSVADYVNIAHKTILQVFKENKLPILVGGTGLYVNSLIDNIQFLTENTSDELRNKLFEQAEKFGNEYMLNKLREIDPDTASQLHPNNIRRIIRALEIYYLTGKTKTQQNETSKSSPSPYNAIMIGITYKNRELLYERIRKRVDIMLGSGLLDEAQSTFGSNLGGAALAIGHKELHKYFSGEISLDDAVELLKRETCRYAKRQLTWFKRDERVNWIYADEVDSVCLAAKQIIKEKGNFEHLT